MFFFLQKSNGHHSVPIEPPPDYSNTDLPYIPPPDYTPPSQHKGMANGKAHIANGRITPVSSWKWWKFWSCHGWLW